MWTLGEETENIITHKENEAISLAFESTAVLVKGQIVALDSDGKVGVAETGDVPFGVVTVGAKAVGDKATVITQFAMVEKGQADGEVAVGRLLATSGYDTATKRSKFIEAEEGMTAVAIALIGGDDEDEVVVGILRVFQTVAEVVS